MLDRSPPEEFDGPAGVPDVDDRMTLRDRLVAVAAARAGALPQRLLTAFAWALSASLILGVQSIWIWAAANIALQLSERVFAARVTKPAEHTAGRSPGVRTYFAYLVAQALAWGSLAPVIWWTGGAFGPAAAIAFLAGSFANVMLTSRGSPTVFFAVTLPFAFYLAVMPVAALVIDKQPAQLFIAIVIAALMFNFQMAWRGAQRVFRSEEAAKRESEQRRREAESAVAAKSAFIAMVSHELRTPISGVLAAASELESAKESDVELVQARAQMVSEAGRLMRTLLNDLLDFAKIEAGHMAVEAIPYDLADVVTQSAAFYRLPAEQRGVALACAVAPTCPAQVVGDPTRVRQILNNLLSNAIKFTDQGEIAVELDLQPMSDGALQAILKVRDTGPGMSAERLERLFRPFDQTDASVARTHGGTGLGLTICRQLARLMGGDISVASLEGAGSTFTVRIVVQSADAPAQPAPEPESGPPLSGLRILVADDHEMNRRVFQLLLEPIARELVFANDGREALDRLSVGPFDVVVLDMNMPEASGPEVAAMVRSGAGPNRDAAVLIVTGSGAPEDIELCGRSGADAHVLKPVDARSLHAAIAAALEMPIRDRASNAG